MKLTVLRVKNWSTIFENNRTRELKKLDWVPMPNKHDSDGFCELMEHPNGTAHYGAWALICQVASRCREIAPGCGGRGTLLREGAKPYDSASLARVSRGSLEIFEEAIPRLISIGWLESITLEIPELTEIPHDGAEIPHDGASSRARAERKGMEGKERERGTLAHIPSEAEFVAEFMVDGIPEEYLKRQYAKFEGNNEWLDRHGKLKRYPVLVRSWWVQDRSTWQSRNGEAEVNAI